MVSLAVAAVSAPKPYVRPRVTAHQPDGGDSGIHIRDFRHPCLEFQDGVSVIPNDVHLERGNRSLFDTPGLLKALHLFKAHLETVPLL